jgi:pyoverdine/dityrosine biosynthesis protein Dit1
MPEATRDELREEKTKQYLADNEPYFVDVDKEIDCINPAFLASSVRL